MKNLMFPSTYDIEHVFDVDTSTGFMASFPPLARLPAQWEPWEAILDDAMQAKLQLGDKLGVSEEDKTTSYAWRARVRELPVLPITDLKVSPVLLRRAHVVLSYLLHFFVQTLPPDSPVSIPPSISVPMLQVATHLAIPPVLTFSDTVLYNWALKTPSDARTPALDNLRTQTMFTNSIHEEEFYLCSSRIELRGVEALDLMRVTMDEAFVGDAIAVRRIASYLRTLARIIGELKALLLSVRASCDPETYYNEVRPWFRGEDSDVRKRKWVFEGIGDAAATPERAELRAPTELSGPSAGQSSLVHALDVFLGVDHASATPDKPSFMARMQTYMPRNHRLFLSHLSANPRPLRTFVKESGDDELQEAFNGAVVALKEFRDAHMIIATLYIIGPARRAARLAAGEAKVKKEPLKGTGGTDLVKFLKETRNRTLDTVLS